MTELAPQLGQAARRFNEYLHGLPDRYPTRHERLQSAMRYALLGAGKRVRPLLCHAAARAVDASDDDTWLVPATALELIHTYSLVHDDLPAMDDDAWRRGRPTTHIAFDEATAILVGDALQALAFQVLTDDGPVPVAPQQQLAWVRALAQAAGGQGMVDGQSMDCFAAAGTMDLTALETMHRHKTGALINAAVVMGAWCRSTPPSDDQITALTRYGQAVGLAFQVVDDILDVTSDTDTLGKDAGSDAAHDKVTYVSLLGLPAARRRAGELQAEALAALQTLPGDTAPLASIADYIVERLH